MPEETTVISPPNPLHLPPGVKLPGGDFGAKNFFPPQTPENAPAVPPAGTSAPDETLTDKMAEAANLRRQEAANPPEKPLETRAPPAKLPEEQPPADKKGEATPDLLDFEQVQLPPKVSEKSAEAFKLVKAQAKQHIAKLRDETSTAQKRIAALEEQLKTAPIGTMTNAEVEKLKAEHKQLSDQLLLVRLEAHPDFQRQYAQPKAAALSAATEILTSQKVEGVDVQKLLALPRAEFAKQVSEVAAKLPSFDATEFSAQMRTAYQITQTQAAALTKSKETFTALQTNQTEQGVAAFNRAMQKVGGDITKYLPKVEPPKGATVEQIEEMGKYNAAIDNLQADARKLALEPSSPDEVAVSAIKAAAYDFHIKHALPAVIKEYQRLQAAYQQLAAEMKQVQAKNPNTMGNVPPAPAKEVLQKELENVPQDERLGYLARKYFPRPGAAR